jgi:hypothetical protein
VFPILGPAEETRRVARGGNSYVAVTDFAPEGRDQMLYRVLLAVGLVLPLDDSVSLVVLTALLMWEI